jgi:hypothetical protein
MTQAVHNPYFGPTPDQVLMAIELRLSISKAKINALQMALKNLRQDVYCDVTSSKDDLDTTDHRITQQQTSHVQKRP